MGLFPKDRYGRFVVFMVLLVLVLRAWAEYDQAALYKCCSAAVPVLFHHAPADAFRFVLNFPASLISWLILPAPAFLPWRGTSYFVLRELLSVFLEIGLTLVLWLGIGRLARSGRLTVVRRAPLKLALPMIFLVAGIALDRVGELQYEGIMRLGAPQEHPVDSGWERDAFVERTFNVPAWAANRQLLYWSYWGWGEYYVLVGVTWFLIGAHFDRWRCPKTNDNPPRVLSWKSRLSWLLCALYGVFLWHMAQVSYYDLRGYPWFSYAVLGWSSVLTLGSIHVLCQDNSYLWGSVARVLSVVLGVIAACLGVLFVITPRYEFFFRGKQFEFALLAWSIMVLTESIYWLVRGANRQIVPSRETL